MKHDSGRHTYLKLGHAFFREYETQKQYRELVRNVNLLASDLQNHNNIVVMSELVATRSTLILAGLVMGRRFGPCRAENLETMMGRAGPGREKPKI